MRPRVLVTGSHGYIGSVLLPYLSERGLSCVGYDTGFFAPCVLYEPPRGELVRRDARDITAADLEEVDVVVHLAGISNDPVGRLDVSRVYDPTRQYSLAIAKLCKDRGVRFIFASSCSVYGVGSDPLLTESSPVSPQTGYSLNKLQIEQDLQSISDANFSPIALRFATVFGSSPRLRLDVVVNMLTGMAVATGKLVLNSDGKAWRPNLHILDACRAVQLAIEAEYDGGQLLVLNVGSDANNLRVLDIAKLIQHEVPGCELTFLADNPDLDKDGLIRDRKLKGGVDTRTYRVSFEKIRRTLPGFECEWAVAEGVREMVARFRRISFDEETFRRRGFYRLQELEYLHGAGYLSDELRWIAPRPVDCGVPSEMLRPAP